MKIDEIETSTNNIQGIIVWTVSILEHIVKLVDIKKVSKG